MCDSSLLHNIINIVEAHKLAIVDSLEVSSRPANLVPPPGNLVSVVKLLLNSLFPLGIYSHQAAGIQAALDGKDICLATPAASGKSLVFMSVAAHVLKNDPQARVLALYPARALIQDQLTKWQGFLGNLGLEVGYIDGGVPTVQRVGILQRSHVVLMTPDVAHAWLLAKVSEVAPREFLDRLKLLILDEAHVYDGVFGTNMAHFMRRLQAVSASQRVICSTATIGEPESFVRRLTGREVVVLPDEQDGSGNPGKTLLLANVFEGKAFDAYVSCISALANSDCGRFLAFADSRRMVEQLVAAAARTTEMGEPKLGEAQDNAQHEGDALEPETESLYRVLPYRAGYEEEDRRAIQRALERGELAGVVSTSALELGIDIGELRVVLLLGAPPSAKAFKQRIGRAGRKSFGVCVLIDALGLVSRLPGGLREFADRKPEPSWLYFENRYIQFANALCAAAELEAVGVSEQRLGVFDTLPPDFGRWLRNELHPTETVPEDLYPLKQRAQAGPHFEFPIRSGAEKSFSVQCHQGPNVFPLGTLTLSQSLREAYPGAIYYYMARPYRVVQYRFREGEIRVQRTKRYTTDPLLQTMVFPKFNGGVLSALVSDEGFLVEAEVQVSERVTGFVEKRGPNRITHQYSPESTFSRKALNRFFETTGVCWFFADRELVSEALGGAVLEAFCTLCSVQSRDIGFGVFHSKGSPLGPDAVQGICIYDATHGSLRLTQQLADRFVEVVDTGLSIARERGENRFATEGILEQLRARVAKVISVPVMTATGRTAASVQTEGDWAMVIAPGERVLHRASDGGTEEVEVKGVRYTPHGLMYELMSNIPTTVRMVCPSDLVPMHGSTQFVRVNLITGEQKPV